MTSSYALKLILPDFSGDKRELVLGDPVSAARSVRFGPRFRSPGAFGLPRAKEVPVQFGGECKGNVDDAGPCNVDVLEYVPHSLTHLETSAHIASRSSHCPDIVDLDTSRLCGIAFLIDLSDFCGSPIPWERIREKLSVLDLPISMLAIKTKASSLPEHYDFFGCDFVSLSPSAAKGIHDWPARIECLIVDLPSIDPEKDGGRLLAHRSFFGLPDVGDELNDTELRAIVELAYFKDFKPGYYFVAITPSRFSTHAVATGVTFWPLIAMK